MRAISAARCSLLRDERVGADEHGKPEDHDGKAHALLLPDRETIHPLTSARHAGHMPQGTRNGTPGVSELKRLALAFLLLFAATPAFAQDWPTKTVRIVVPFGAGATPDTIARLIADKLQQKLGQNFIVENKPGASGMTGTDAVAKAEPDGYTIGIVDRRRRSRSTRCCSPRCPTIRSRTIALITMLTTQPSALAVPANFGVNSVAELVALHQEGAGQVQFRLDRQRLAVASCDGGDRAQERRQAHAHSLRLVAAGDDRA